MREDCATNLNSVDVERLGNMFSLTPKRHQQLMKSEERS
jgi:hypothetical protein